MRDTPLNRLLAWAVLGAVLSTQYPVPGAAQDIPAIGQPTADFYGAAGSGVKVAWQLDRAEVPEDGEVVATLKVTNVTNPGKVTRPDLKNRDDFRTLFVVTDVPGPPAVGPREVAFAYRLRPRNRQTAEVPGLRFHYYNRAAAAGKQFPLTTAAAVPITVTAVAPKAAAPAVPLAEPDRLFAVATGPDVLGRPATTPGMWAWVAIGLAGPVSAAVWFVLWQRLYPGAARLARIRRSRAARRAVDAIRRAGRAPDPPAAVAAAVLGYLRARHPLPPGAATPPEVAAALAEFGVPAADAAATADLLRACDAARFAPAGDGGAGLAAVAEALVARLEAA
ncbi:MAG: hypothetical protein C0501_25275 [Isosphaera sp.]|nr:hypothetical protein [Isosphaera sp.]